MQSHKTIIEYRRNVRASEHVSWCSYASAVLAMVAGATLFLSATILEHTLERRYGNFSRAEDVSIWFAILVGGGLAVVSVGAAFADLLRPRRHLGLSLFGLVLSALVITWCIAAVIGS